MTALTHSRQKIVAASAEACGRRRWGSRLLMAGGLLSAFNGAAHWVLPMIYPWSQHVRYEPVRWALYATTVFFGILLVFGGILTVLVARDPGMPSRVVAWVGAGMASFWVLAAGYELAVPFPAPGARWALPAFSVVVALLHLAGLTLARTPPRPAPGATKAGSGAVQVPREGVRGRDVVDRRTPIASGAGCSCSKGSVSARRPPGAP